MILTSPMKYAIAGFNCIYLFIVSSSIPNFINNYPKKLTGTIMVIDHPPIDQITSFQFSPSLALHIQCTPVTQFICIEPASSALPKIGKKQKSEGAGNQGDAITHDVNHLVH